MNGHKSGAAPAPSDPVPAGTIRTSGLSGHPSGLSDPVPAGTIRTSGLSGHPSGLSGAASGGSGSESKRVGSAESH
ncbi:MAG: hypothetical protein ACRDOH_08885, partial [Streptosporangiaceae bacterium]